MADPARQKRRDKTGLSEVRRASNVARWPVRGPVLSACLLVCLTIAAYAPALRGGFVWDDDDYVTKNQAVQSVTGLPRIWLDPRSSPQYYPLVFSSFWVEYRLWELAPAGYHAVNIMLHAGVAVLLWRVLVALSVPGAWLAAAIFAVHPAHVESVAWITERKNVLSGALALGSLLMWIRWAGLDGTPRLRAHKRLYAVALILFLASLFSKTAVAPLPIVMAAIIWWKRGTLRTRDLACLLPFVALAAASAAMTVYVEHRFTSHEGEGGDWPYTILERTLIAGRALWFYAGKLAWPHPITFVYPRWQVNAAHWQQYAFPLGIAVLILLLWIKRHHWGTGPLLAITAYVAMALPILGFINIYYMRYSLFADHFQYLPSMSLIALIAAGLTIGADKTLLWVTNGAWRRVSTGLVSLLLLALAVRTWVECKKFHDTKALWADTLQDNPAAWIAHNNLGTLLKDEQMYDEAIRHLSEAVRLKPDHARAHFNLASAYLQKQQFDAALTHLRIGLRYLPDHGEARLNLANVLTSRGEFAEAEANYLKAISLLPKNDPLPRYNYAIFLYDMRRTADAIAALRSVLQSRPKWPPAQQMLEQILATQPANLPR